MPANASGSETLKYERVKKLASAGTFYVDASEPDQGAPASGPGITVYDVAHSIGPNRFARIVLAHNGVGNVTTYLFDTSLNLSGYPFLFFDFEPGAIMARITGDEILRVYSPENILARFRQLTDAPMFEFEIGGTVYAEWYGVDGAGDDVQIQYALDKVRDDGCVLSLMPGHTYTMNGTVALQLTEERDATRWTIEGNGATLDFTALSSGNLFTVGAAADIYFAEEGGTVIRNLKILGPESVPPQWAAHPETDCTGLLLKYASGIRLDSVYVQRCRTGIKSGFVFPLEATNINVFQNFVGLHLDDASNVQNWEIVRANECWYGVVIYKSGDFNAAAKIDNVSFNKLCVEDSQVGIHIDPGAGPAQPFIRRIYFDGVYAKGIVYDVFRIGLTYAFAFPSQRGADRSANIVGVEIGRSSWGGPYDQDSAALVFSSNSSVREFVGYLSVADTADAVVNNPKAGDIIFLDDESTGGAGFKVKHYDGANSISRHMLNDGTVFNGARTDVGEHFTRGTEISKDGYLSAHRTNDHAAYLSRNSAGDIAQFSRGSTVLGHIGGDSDDNIYMKSHASGKSVDLISYDSPDYKSVRWNGGVDAFYPLDDNVRDLGRSSFRWGTVYAGTGTINTSDRNEKQQIEELSSAEKAVAVRLKGMVRKFKFNDAVAAEGESAKIHVGILAQDIIKAFETEGLDPEQYGIVTRDVWWTDEAGRVYETGKEAEGLKKHARLGVRYNELLAFIIAGI